MSLPLSRTLSLWMSSKKPSAAPTSAKRHHHNCGKPRRTQASAGGRLSVDEMLSGQQGLSDDSITELRLYKQVENGTPSTSPPYWDADDDEDDSGPKPSALYGKFTWKIEKFSQINKRELQSSAFEVGGYKWYCL